ncbi:N-acetyltransferase [Myxococcota bacterium]|nr:N-acetyltransferase [Myxococcota bacterium]
MIIRPERADDADAITAVHRAAFPGPGEAALVLALRAAGRLVDSFVAVEEGVVVGHVGSSPVTGEGLVAAFGVAPLAVLEAWRGQGVGAALMRRSVESARERGAAALVLLGDRRYYARFGFVPASRFGLHDEYGGGDAFQALPLRPGGLDGARGVVRYAPEFLALGDTP